MIDDCKKYGLTRDDFIKYKEYFFKMLEESEVRNISIDVIGKSVNQKHDKSFKDILTDEKEMSKFLEQFIGVKVDTEQLEEQKNNYINKQFEKRQSDILYKIKNKDIYVLVEHQSKVDTRKPRRIFEYCMGIMMALEKTQKVNDESNPIIVPIVIYTGANKWNVKTNYYLASAWYDELLYQVNPAYRSVYEGDLEDYELGVRILVFLSSDVLFSSERADTTTLSGGNLEGETQEFNIWNIQ